MAPAVTVECLSKSYQIRGSASTHRTLREAITAPRRRRGPAEMLWALRNLEFDVEEGEAVGVIGSNGAGKSTLLKILARITHPTTGSARTRGRVGALLEVGTGFHHELTGRENVYVNGAILGLRRAEVRRRFDEIVAFAQVERFVDTPVKFYSTGMQMRLAFAVAANLEPQILVVDEVLAVGDAAFQARCLGRMGAAARDGRTVIFVSHNLVAVEALCSRAIWLERGMLAEDGEPRAVIGSYLRESLDTVAERIWDEDAAGAWSEGARPHRARVRSAEGTASGFFDASAPLVLEFEYWNEKPGTDLGAAFHLYDDRGLMIIADAFSTSSPASSPTLARGLIRQTCRIPGHLLTAGSYRVEFLIVENQATIVHQEENALSFHVHESTEGRGAWYGEWPAAVRPALGWTSECVRADAPSPRK